MQLQECFVLKALAKNPAISFYVGEYKQNKTNKQTKKYKCNGSSSENSASDRKSYPLKYLESRISNEIFIITFTSGDFSISQLPLKRHQVFLCLSIVQICVFGWSSYTICDESRIRSRFVDEDNEELGKL
ncbi:uncharacterized protein LOC119587801 [Penaeus monodon]|uniref:uncharacterized protein LOC119587801 n=1 Tax=Penaeus monodon TaxID=6687 RepID=UPI0018A6E74C|nr:uncharacterized protein LOC119587801 [Penaeus monodon]